MWFGFFFFFLVFGFFFFFFLFFFFFFFLFFGFFFFFFLVFVCLFVFSSPCMQNVLPYPGIHAPRGTSLDYVSAQALRR